jgi:hypothetical protein
VSEYLDNLRDAVTAMHGCDCEHSATSRVVEMFEGRVVFSGDVETFTLSAHPQASLAFAWAFDDDGEPRYLAVLNVPPINDPSDAVRAAIASGHFK